MLDLGLLKIILGFFPPIFSLCGGTGSNHAGRYPNLFPNRECKHLVNITCPKIIINCIIFKNLPYKQHFARKGTRSGICLKKVYTPTLFIQIKTRMHMSSSLFIDWQQDQQTDQQTKWIIYRCCLLLKRIISKYFSRIPIKKMVL